jgi:DNA-binding NarL/FixJ family response regulator
MDPRFTVTQVADSAEEALESLPSTGPGIIVLDHGLAGPLPGLAAAPLLKELAPESKIIMFTAHAELQARADREPSIDGFLLKTDSERLLPLAQQLTGLGPAEKAHG